MSHTPGPWSCGKQDRPIGYFPIYARTGATKLSRIATTDAREVGFGICEEEHRANARLIAAAPELARCLEAMLKITCGSCEGGDGRCVTADGFDACLLAREAKAVLAKAKGEPQ